MTIIDQIKNTIPITDVLERYAGVNLARAKVHKETFNINCPYHADRSPSFTVYTSSNKFRCWAGCNDGKVGSVIDIVMLSQNVGVKDAINLLEADYGLEKPNSAQAKEWRTKRAIRGYTVAQKKLLHQTVMDAMTEFKKIELMARNVISSIKTIDDLERVGEYYHLITQIEYWLDCLTDDDPDVQIETITEVNTFLKKTKTEGGESA